MARERIPTGEAVESQFQTYHENSRVIIGLRTYLQHEQLFPYSIRPDIEADEYKFHFIVDLEDVWVMKSQLTPEKPYGYEKPPSEIYQSVEGGEIDLEWEINQHYGQAKKLVQVTDSYVKETMNEEIIEFNELAEPFLISNLGD